MTAAHKKGKFRILLTSVWNIFRKTSATPSDRIVFMCLEAGPHSHYTGLFQVHLVDISEYTGLSGKEVLQALDRLSGWGLIVYDPSRQLVFVKGMLRRQLGTSTPNENNIAGIVYYAERMAEDSPAVLAFMEENREIPEFEAILEDLSPPPPPGPPQGSITGEDHPPGGPTRDLRRETSDERLTTTDEKLYSIIAEKSPALTPPLQPSSSSPDSTPDGKVNVETLLEDLSPLGSSSKSTAKASGKGKPGNGHGLSTAQMKVKGLKIVAKNYHAGKLNVAELSDVLRNEYGYTQTEINSPTVMDTLFPRGKEAVN